jgi:hypothetical protein
VTWRSGTTATAETIGSGLTVTINAKAVGTSVITVTTLDGNHSDTCTLTVVPTGRVTGVTLSPSSLSVDKGSTTTLTATVQPASATNKAVTWQSANNGIATVAPATAQTATVTGIQPGNTTITVTTEDGNYTRTCNVTVAPLHDVYLGGAFGMLLNGVVLPAYNGSTVNAIHVDASNTVHAAGAMSGEASYWKDGVRTTLPKSNGTSSATALAMAVEGTNVYICGYETSSSRDRAKLWVNGANVELPELDGATYSQALGVCHLSGATYVCGGIRTQAYYATVGGTRQPGFALWTATAGNPPNLETLSSGNPPSPLYEAFSIAAGPDGRLYFGHEVLGVISKAPGVDGFTVPIGGQALGVPVAYSVRFSGSTLYACGYKDQDPYPPAYWVLPAGGSATATELPEGLSAGSEYAEALDIAALDGIVYICGLERRGSGSDAPKFWKGTALQPLPVSAGAAQAVFVKTR